MLFYKMVDQQHVSILCWGIPKVKQCTMDLLKQWALGLCR